MKPNGIVCIDFSRFKSIESLIEWISKEENKKYRDLYFRYDTEYPLSFSKVFNRVHKIWIKGNFILFMKERKSKDIIINPDIKNFIKINSIEITDPNIGKPKEPKIKKEIKSEPESRVEKIPIILDIDSILDRINQVGLNGLTKEETEFLKNA